MKAWNGSNPCYIFGLSAFTGFFGFHLMGEKSEERATRVRPNPSHDWGQDCLD
jgi:hypothetical protein